MAACPLSDSKGKREIRALAPSRQRRSSFWTCGLDQRKDRTGSRKWRVELPPFSRPCNINNGGERFLGSSIMPRLSEACVRQPHFKLWPEGRDPGLTKVRLFGGLV
ncbi:hypothetical protein RRG08_050840 [Elysia crispata]|uniref:Uncharacterized protein n=1 Tax=Elysia crispata TaxID=231223 RepID=A0AAE1DWN9_9GAST|nr:hypothetical protein RRG08_050840 [Elysia crispata]